MWKLIPSRVMLHLEGLITGRVPAYDGTSRGGEWCLGTKLLSHCNIGWSMNKTSVDSVQCGALRFKYARLVFPSSKIVGWSVIRGCNELSKWGIVPLRGRRRRTCLHGNLATAGRAPGLHKWTRIQKLESMNIPHQLDLIPWYSIAGAAYDWVLSDIQLLRIMGTTNTSLRNNIAHDRTNNLGKPTTATGLSFLSTEIHRLRA